MEINWIIHIIILICLGIATITDIKKREVPDTLNFGMMILGVVLGIIFSIINNSWDPLITSSIGLGIGYLIGAAMFYSGQWGGGDAKMLMGMGAIIGIPLSVISKSGLNIASSGIIDLGSLLMGKGGEIPFFITTIITIFIAGGIYGLFYSIGLIIKNWKEFKNEFRKKREEKKIIKTRKLVLAGVLLILILMLITPYREVRLSIGILGVMIFTFQYLIIISKVIENTCLIKTVPVRRLTEGEWIVEDVIVEGKRICGPKDLGISLEQIKKLKKLKIKTIKIKEGIPFIPGFLLGYILMIILNNWINILI